jgi:hypothetical protein
MGIDSRFLFCYDTRGLYGKTYAYIPVSQFSRSLTTSNYVIGVIGDYIDIFGSTNRA